MFLLCIYPPHKDRIFQELAGETLPVACSSANSKELVYRFMRQITQQTHGAHLFVENDAYTAQKCWELHNIYIYI